MDPMAGLMTNAAAPAGAPATVDVSWTLFQSVYSAVDLPARQRGERSAWRTGRVPQPDDDRDADRLHDVQPASRWHWRPTVRQCRP